MRKPFPVSFKLRPAGKIILALVAICGAATSGVGGGDQDARKPWRAPHRVAGTRNPVAANETSVALGKELYLQECAACHGATGRGDGARVKELEVSPANLASSTLGHETDGALFWKISEGNAPMPSFRLRFVEKERWMIVNYVRTLALLQTDQTGGDPAGAESDGQSPTPAAAQADPATVTRGKELYERECAECHGSAGKGDGPKASDLTVNPPDLSDQEIQEESDAALFRKIANGKKPMPAFGSKLPDNDRWMIVHFVRTLAEHKSQGTEAVRPPSQGRSDVSTVEGPSMMAYLHVLINPMPIYGLAAGTLALLAGLLLRNRSARILALLLVFLCAASAWPAWFFGHKAYRQVYAQADAEGRRRLGVHMHRADQWIYAFYALAASAVAAMLLPKRLPKSDLPLALLTLSLALACLAVGGWIAKAGGQIRHSEFRGISIPGLQKEKPDHGADTNR